MKHIIIINGPNLNLLGKRQPEIYGSRSFDEYFKELSHSQKNRATLSYYQSNHEGALIDKLHEVGFDNTGIVLNAGGYTHTSIALRDAVAAIEAPVVEVHISNIAAREPFRKHSYLTDVCAHHVIGKGLQGYAEAIDWLCTDC